AVAGQWRTCYSEEDRASQLCSLLAKAPFQLIFKVNDCMKDDGINADPMELEKFSQLAHRWWDPNSEFKPLHEINPLRLNYIDEIAGLAGKTVVDVGCGGGILSEAMAARGAK